MANAPAFLPPPNAPATLAESPTLIVNNVLMTSTYQGSSIVDVANAREVTVLFDIDMAAAGSQLTILPLFSAQGVRPAATDDVWFLPAEDDGSVTASLPSGTVLAGADFTLVPEFARRTLRPLILKIGDTADNATDELRLAVTFKCSWARWFQIHCADVTGVGTLCTVSAWAVRGI